LGIFKVSLISAKVRHRFYLILNFGTLKSTNYIQLILAYFFISVLLAVAYIWLIHFYVKGWLKTPHQTTKSSLGEYVGVSVIISVRNEEANIKACIESILRQDYPSSYYELIVVNDFSTDNTLKVLAGFGNQIKVYKLSEYLSSEAKFTANKKKAITLAVNEAKYDIILCGDGDCTYGERWISSMMQYHRKYHKKFISGPVDYIDARGFWKNFLLMDLVSMIGVTAGSIGQKKPVMASGANMLFEKKSFLSLGGYEGNDNIASGDDVFLMQKIFLEDNKAIGFVKNAEAFAYTQAPESFAEFINQRIRWTSKSGNMIDFRVKVVLLLNYLFYLTCFFNLFVLPWVDISFLGIGLLLLALKILIDILFFSNILAFYNKSFLLKWILPMEILHIIYVSFMGVLAIFGSYTWKGRNVKK
jgi:cellulose synthase/poly-beta-1,6-N-acetylglucosamine synthase-like glycosyltransferase